ncbi:DUF177 domain-containing protein [Aerococcaceae bacterium DSM 111020]|nr:DUF177 domain-containing protein [Aerococcaceae bacterium DSM 111020]
MKFTIQQIKEQPNQLLKLEEVLNIKNDLIERMSSIIDVHNTHVDGYYVAVDNEVLLHCTIDTDLTLPSTRTLEPVTIHLTIPVKERYVTNNQATNLDEHEEVTIVVEDETLNLQEVVIDNILLNIPMKIIGDDESDDALPSGNDWTVMTEETYLQQQAEIQESAVDPRFAALQDLLDNED